MIPSKFLHNTTFSVQLPYDVGHSLKKIKLNDVADVFAFKFPFSIVSKAIIYFKL